MQRTSGNQNKPPLAWAVTWETLGQKTQGTSPLEKHDVDGGFHFPNRLHAKKWTGIKLDACGLAEIYLWSKQKF